MKYRLIQIHRMSQLSRETVSLPFLFFRTAAASYISNPDIFSWIITFHYIILRLGKPSYRYTSLIHPTQTRETIRLDREKIFYSPFFWCLVKVRLHFAVLLFYSEVSTCFSLQCLIIQSNWNQLQFICRAYFTEHVSGSPLTL